MPTDAKKEVVKKTAKKSTKTVGKVARVSLTVGQAQTIAKFYEKQGKKVPAFLAKNL